MIYLDNNATTQPAPEVIEAVVDCLRDGWGNPSSMHGHGQAAKARLGQARAQGRDAADAGRMAALRDAMETALHARLPVLCIHGEGAPRLPNTSCLRIPGLDAEWLLDRLGRAGICAASGSACSVGGTEPSHVLLAMGVSRDEALETIRISLSRATTAAEVARLVEVLCDLAGALSRAA